MSIFSRDDIIPLLNSYPQNNAALSGESAALLLSALDVMAHRYLWDNVLDSEWDILDGKIAVAALEVMTDVQVVSEGGSGMLIDLSLMKYSSGYGTFPPLRRPISDTPNVYQVLYYQNALASASDEYYLDIYLAGGDYKIIVPMFQGQNGGMYEVGIDNVNDETVSFYNASIIHQVNTEVVCNNVPSGINRLRFKCVGKDAASNGYYWISQAVTILRVA